RTLARLPRPTPRPPPSTFLPYTTLFRSSISVLTREQLETRPFTSLGDAVRNVEGVSVVGDSPDTTDIVIRGMPGEYTLIMLDGRDRKSTRLNSSHVKISYAVFCLKKKKS